MHLRQTPQNHNFVDGQTPEAQRATKVRCGQPGDMCTNCERNKIKILLRSQ